MSVPGPIRVAIVGGGCAAVAAAFELTRPEHAGHFEVTLYQQGWRLGGKGASGRGPAGRIEEHGLHLWMGWYENAFRLLRECYAELGLDWTHGFEPAGPIGVTEHGPGGTWEPWARAFPAEPGLPGDPCASDWRPTVSGYMQRTARLIRTLVADLSGGPDVAMPPRSPGAARRALPGLARYGTLATLAAIARGIGALEVALGSFGELEPRLVLSFLDAARSAAMELLERRLSEDPRAERIWHVIDLALATIQGSARDGLLVDPRGFDPIDGLDCREWLRRGGASERALGCGYLRGLYDLGFGYEAGDPARPRVSAAEAMRGFMRAFFTYRGSFFWRMRGGMGDVVFAPFYEALRRRGVRFRFFHRLRNVGLGGEERDRYVRTLEFDVQARPARGDDYDPLIEVGGMPCWPAAPRWDRLAGGAALAREGRRFESHWDGHRVGTRVLRVGEDFDFVVLGVGLGAVPAVCSELVAADPRWREMVARVKTVATQALQLWLRPDMEALGRPGPALVLSGFVEPFDTWADMRHLLPFEQWPEAPGTLAYFCSVLGDVAGIDADDPALPATQQATVRANAERFLERDVRHLWPRAIDDQGRFRWDALVAPPGTGAGLAGKARLGTQYWTANVNPSDRYTLALPGTAAHRISPLDRSADNLTVCGDWTAAGFNMGCVETAVMSGRLAAHALSTRPRLEEIVGFDHP